MPGVTGTPVTNDSSLPDGRNICMWRYEGALSHSWDFRENGRRVGRDLEEKWTGKEPGDQALCIRQGVCVN